MRPALIHSPLVGPSNWRRTADALAAAGLEAIAVDYGGVRPPDWYDGAARRIAAAFGWMVRRERLHHLAMLTHPDRLTGILAEVADALAA